MSTKEPFCLRWGIMATGKIAYTFVKDLLTNTETRGTLDVCHIVAAVSSASSSEKTQAFINSLNLSCTGYNSYDQLVADSNVDAIYIATPHSHHFQHVMMALQADKHVLCEKPVTVNAHQARILCEEAKKRNLFLMEAMWTRYLPLSIEVLETIRQGRIGEVLRVTADTSFGDEVEKTWGTEHRMLNKNLAGGALLDLGIYSLTWVFQCLYHTLPESQRQPPCMVSAQMTLNYLTGADEATSILVTFPTTTPDNIPEWKSQAIATTNLRVSTDPDGRGTSGPAIRIQGTKGEIQVDGPSFRPERYRVIQCRNENNPTEEHVREYEHHIPDGHRGMYWEADEVARCVRDGKLFSDTLPWNEMIVIMELMDEARRQGGLVYPKSIEDTHY
ncbi:hypothetical protein BGW36DRAFT_417785 [Talaromyces proteolyticus]|uniref:D-xylose 1-dehydrogenase (NADP(+), D-xylono-1,5-lactone-forming) n=1 Tax=Talaromyces proteolyticus TaxID=1131652 RepID=A0AAD4Q0B2_9EURO|nr:uncharacterized protein BGW36DRAFT_417785 [Talaromyces proteolyticus]KAH8696743.1 hypothetical protein BGW36DRAFT_417785 [Talaromyces proteolyticus]